MNMVRSSRNARALVAVLAAGCARAEVTQGRAAIEPRSGSAVTGTATFSDLPGGGMKLVVDIENAQPGTHGLHVHETGDCSAADASSAGGHFNPAGNPHGGSSDSARHNGDLGNIEIGEDGKGHLELVNDLLTVKEGPESVVGRAIVFHEKADDLRSQPAGDAGARLGCGVIESAGK